MMEPDEPGITLTSPEAPQKFKFENHYLLGDNISKGSFGVVYKTKHNVTKQEFAVKVINRSKLTKRDVDVVLREVEILKDCTDIEYIIKLVDFYESPTHFHIVQLLARGGDVFERLASRTNYNERDARDLASQLLKGMEALHERNIAHRDLKPENLLLRNMIDDSGILIADFGFAKVVPEEGLKTRCGTPSFVAPEVLVQDCRYNYMADMWSVGCLLYMLIGGYPPFQDKNHRGLFRKIRGADFCFHEAYWKNVSVSAKQLISSLLTTDPKYRCSASMALEKSNWLKIKDNRLEENDLSSSLGELKAFQARRSLKGAMQAVLWSVRSKFRTVGDKEFSEQIESWDRDDEAKTRVNQALLTSVRPTLRFDDVYELIERIHESSSSAIWVCKHKERGEIFAVKQIDRKKGQVKSINGKSWEEAVLHELAVLKALNHPNIIQIQDFFESDKYFYLVMEHMEGGDVFERVMKLKRYTEKDARDLAKSLLEAVAHMHGQGICHRDLKPQNLLLKSKDDDADIKVADFSFACRVHTPQSLTTRCGTPSYVAPEILKNIPYDQSSDMWSVGVILYVLLCGYPPFMDDNQGILFQKIRTGEWEFADKDWKNISEEAKELIRNLLLVDPLRRLKATEALESPWLLAEDKQLSEKDLSNVVDSIKTKTTKLKTVARTIMWMNAKGGSMRNMEQMECVLERPEEEPSQIVEELVARPEPEFA